MVRNYEIKNVFVKCNYVSHETVAVPVFRALTKIIIILLTESVSCPAGTYREGGMTECVACQTNTITTTPGASSCSLCSAGSVSNGDRTECGKEL